MAVLTNQKYTLTPRTALSNTVLSVRGGPTTVWGWTFHNPNVAESWVQFFNKQPVDVVLGTTAPDYTLKLAGSSETVLFLEGASGVPFSTGLSWATTTTETGATGPSSAVSSYLVYN